ncbi:MAG: 4-(cytidine 5'-diphospho)-2-C-methyl-D-erythritol kinase [Clostridiales bacterium]
MYADHRNGIVIKAAAKINWGLAILGTRTDGYHLLRSVMQRVDLQDTLSIRQAQKDSCQMALAVSDEDNLALRCWRLLKQKYNLPGGLAINIEKVIPAGGGLAGGSADGAAVMLAVNELFHLGLTNQELRQNAVTIGADLPFCLLGQAALAEGIGEKLTPLRPRYAQKLLLANPGIGINTAAVFALFDQLSAPPIPDMDALATGLTTGDAQAVRAQMRNMLEPAAFTIAPMLIPLKNLLEHDGLQVVMSGSGATMIGWSADNELVEFVAAKRQSQINWLRVVNTIGDKYERRQNK